MTELIASGGVRIPPAPATALRMRRLIENPDYSIEELAKVVASDQALSVAVLTAANQVRGPVEAPISSVEAAVRRLGIPRLARTVLAVSTASGVGQAGPLASLRVLAWRRSLTSALLCRFVSERRGGRGEDAFACGLLHDFGWIVALTSLEQLLILHPHEGQRSQAQWLALVDQFHILLGHMAATAWQLPPLVADSILYHHSAELTPAPHRVMVELVASCDQVVTALEGQSSVTEADLLRVVPGLTAEVVVPLIQALPKMALEVTGLMQLVPAGGPLPVASMVSRLDQSLRGKIVAVSWPTSWVNPAGIVSGVVTGVAADGFVVDLTRPPRENYVVKFVIAAADSELEVVVTPIVVERDADRYRVVLRLYGLGGEAKRVWDDLYTKVLHKR